PTTRGPPTPPLFPYTTLFRSAPERLPGRLAEHPRRLHQALALGDECRARQQIDVWVEHQHQHQNHAAGGTHRRKAYAAAEPLTRDRKSTRLNSSHVKISYAVF